VNSMNLPQLLIVEDSKSIALLFEGYLSDEGCDVIHTASGEEAIRIVSEIQPAVILLDLNLPDIDGFKVLDYIQDHQLPVSVIVVTGTGSVDKAVEAMRRGALDFIEKPVAADRLIITVRNALERNRLVRLVRHYEEDQNRSQYEGFVGASAAMQTVYGIIDRAAPSSASVFVTGESGTGKELCASALHAKNSSRDDAFVTINCAAIAPELMESEIFGHVKGSFTGATANRDGAAIAANGGTLFLDEICEMRLDLQSKLLRLIQTGEFQKVGSSKTTKVDIRFISATNRSPHEEVRAGRFREDLLHRLQVIPIHLPPLRERDGDVLLLARRFLKEYAEKELKPFAGLDKAAEEEILLYDWPGNVRELQNVIRRVVVLNTAESVSIAMIREAMLHNVGSGLSVDRDRNLIAVPVEAPAPQKIEPIATSVVPLSTVKERAIAKAIEVCGGNVVQAAALLQINPSTIYRSRWSSSTEG